MLATLLLLTERYSVSLRYRVSTAKVAQNTGTSLLIFGFPKKMWTPVYSPHLSIDDRQTKGTISFKSSVNQSWDLWGVYFLSLVNSFYFLSLKEPPLGWWFQCEGMFYTTPAGYALAVFILSLTNMSSLNNMPSSTKSPNTRSYGILTGKEVEAIGL